MPSVELCIPSRDGRLRDEVLTAAVNACQYAQAHGIESDICRINDKYTVAACRNRAVAGFFTRKASHILFVDDDVSIPMDAITKLIAAGKDVASGCIPAVKESQGQPAFAYVQVRPLFLHDWLKTWPTKDEDCESVGGGCMMIRRNVLEAIGHPWFRWPEQYTPGIGIRAISDDADFCERVRRKGFKVWAIASVRCGHRADVDAAMLIKE